ncbi:MAG: aminopeptidase [Nitrosomonas sp.]
MNPKGIRAWKITFVGIQFIWLSSCVNLPYYFQAIRGHVEVIHRSQPISRIISSPDADTRLKNALAKVIELRQFATDELKLPENHSYTSYADLNRPYVVWNVFAAPELSLSLKQWCFVQVGCVNYRGFFLQDRAEQYAKELKTEGYDVHVGGIRAYSTLGWFSDPVLNTFIDYSEMNLARLIFHELAHQILYVQDDTVFNESFATAVEHEGVTRWFKRKGTNQEQQAALLARYDRELVFVDLVLKHRQRLLELYDSDQSDSEKRLQKSKIYRDLKNDFLRVRAENPEFSSYDPWFAQPLNNALLSTVSIYTQLVPAFQAIIRQSNGDMDKFYETIKYMSELPKPERNRILQQAIEPTSLKNSR